MVSRPYRIEGRQILRRVSSYIWKQLVSSDWLTFTCKILLRVMSMDVLIDEYTPKKH